MPTVVIFKQLAGVLTVFLFIFLAVTTIAVAQAITMILILDIMALHLQEPGNFYSIHPSIHECPCLNPLMCGYATA